MAIRIGINGFGRIGRLSLRTMYAKYGDAIEVVAINDLTDAKTNTFLLQHDSNYGSFNGTVAAEGKELLVNGRKISVYAEREPGEIPWDRDGVDIVLESTRFGGYSPRLCRAGACCRRRDDQSLHGVNHGADTTTVAFRHHAFTRRSSGREEGSLYRVRWSGRRERHCRAGCEGR